VAVGVVMMRAVQESDHVVESVLKSL